MEEFREKERQEQLKHEQRFFETTTSSTY